MNLIIKEREENRMSAIKVLENTSVETKREFYVPTITDTTPVRPEKEIDLSFWQSIERNRRAKEYSQSVQARRESKRICGKVKRILSGILAGTFMIAFSVGFFVIGLYF